MKKSEQIRKEIMKKDKELIRLSNTMDIINREIRELQKELENTELQECIDGWLLEHFGVFSEKEARDGRFIVFDKEGKYVKTVICNESPEADFPKAYACTAIGESREGTLEEWLMEHKLYSQPASSFIVRDRRWYGLTFKMMLRNFGWEFDKNGFLKNTDW